LLFPLADRSMAVCKECSRNGGDRRQRSTEGRPSVG